jgi:cation:H+ antiporter
LAIVPFIVWAFVALGSTAVVWAGSAWLDEASSRLSAHYDLPEIVRGAVAVGSSFPELSTAIISSLVHGAFELGVAAIVGSALFNIMVIPSLSALISGRQLPSNRDLVYKEAQFYIIAVAVLLLVFSFAVIYFPVHDPAGAILGEIGRGLALLPIAVYGLYVFVQYQDTMTLGSTMDSGGVKPLKEWGRLAAAMLLILIGVEGLVRAAINFGDLLRTPSFLWGITVVAAGTSVPDAFVSIRAARKGDAVTSLANDLGSNVFDLLVAIPAGVLVAGTAVINYSVAAP